MEIDESDCCGNGCANCILDHRTPKKLQPDINHNHKINCLLQYRNYELIEKTIPHPSDLNIFKLKFRLKSREENLSIFLPSGHHIMMKIQNCRRPYSPYVVDRENIAFEILINLKPNGQMSQYIKELIVGDFVEFIGPIGSFFHENTGIYDELIICTHGVAVAPTIPIIEEILQNEDDFTKINFIGCFTNLNSFYFRDKIHNFKQFWNFNSHIYLSREEICTFQCTETENNCQHWRSKLKYHENITPKRLTALDIQCILGQQHKQTFNKCKFIICGSKEFEKFIKLALENINMNEDQLVVL